MTNQEVVEKLGEGYRMNQPVEVPDDVWEVTMRYTVSSSVFFVSLRHLRCCFVLCCVRLCVCVCCLLACVYNACLSLSLSAFAAALLVCALEYLCE